MCCDLCKIDESKYKYRLDDNSTIDICMRCGEILYGKDIHAPYRGRLFQIISLLEYVNSYNENLSKLDIKILKKVS